MVEVLVICQQFGAAYREYASADRNCESSAVRARPDGWVLLSQT